MKLRLRFVSRGSGSSTSRTICIDGVNDCTIQDLKLQNNLTDQYSISLNGRDVLDEEKNLAELGVVSGDLLYVMSSTDDSVHCPGDVSVVSHTEALSEAGISASLGSVIPLAGQHVANMKTTGSNEPPASANTSHMDGLESSGHCDDDSLSASGAPETDMEHDTCEHAEDYQRLAGILQRELESECRPVNECEINRYMHEAHLCSEATDSEIPQKLMRMLSAEQGQTETEMLCVALHVMMLECGFSLCTQAGDEDLEVKDDPSCEWPLQQNWNLTPGVYRLTYQYAGLPSTSLVMVGMGRHLVIHGHFAEEKHFNLTIETSQYMKGTVLAANVPVYRCLPLLTRQFKDNVVWPLVKEIRTTLGLPPLMGLLALPQELQIQILSVYLDVPSLLCLAEVSQDFKLISRDSFIWRLAYVRKFGKRSNMDLSEDWFQLFKTSYLKTKELLRHYQKMDRILCMPDWLRQRHPYPLLPGAPNRGILGGDYDLRPGFSGIPAMFHPGQGYCRGRVIPRPHPISDPDAESPLLDMHENLHTHATQNNNQNFAFRHQQTPLPTTRGPLRLF